LEAFVRRALRHPADVAVADRLSGVLTYRQLLVAATLVSRQVRLFPGESVGIMLPASVAADLAYFALLLAGKLPVMLNWTLGPTNLRHAVERLSLHRIVTSRKLVDRLGVESPGAEFVYVEDLRGKISRGAAARAWAGSYLFPRRLLGGTPWPRPEQPAVVLFTSGSESAPKAVPLSHANLIANVRASTRALQCTRRDRLLGFLPPFHSFGLMGTLVAPVITGVRVVHYPDPTHAAGLVRTAAAYQPTLLMTTPTFLGYMLACGTSEDLRSLRVVGTGAEKCPEAMFARAAELMPEAVILEGYGITECSPLVASNQVGRIKPGSVGMLARGVEACVVDPDTGRPLPTGARGMLLVRGPSVFHGYLHYGGPDPFTELDGQRWYVTGDLVQRDEEGFLFFCGRLKRFLKVGGEMVSLPALEEPLADRWPPTEDGPQVAVEGIETPGGRKIVLFTTTAVSLREANALLFERGFRGVMRLDEVRQVAEIPVLGTGKTDYKALRQLLTATVP
jgi:long-chain-fatty-acid--[acyl-carrier-protein] ligase